MGFVVSKTEVSQQDEGLLEKGIVDNFNRHLKDLRDHLGKKYNGFFKDDFYIKRERRSVKLYAYKDKRYDLCLHLDNNWCLVDGALVGDDELVSIFYQTAKQFDVNTAVYFELQATDLGYYQKHKSFLGTTIEFHLIVDEIYTRLYESDVVDDVNIDKQYCRKMGYDYKMVVTYMDKGYSKESIYIYLAYLKQGIFICEGKTHKSVQSACKDLGISYGAIVNIMLSKECDLWDAVEYYDWMESNKEYLEVCSTGLLAQRGKEARMINKSLKGGFSVEDDLYDCFDER